MANLSDYKYPEFNEDFEGMIPQNGGGGNVLTLYGRYEEEDNEQVFVVYIDPEYTKKQFDTYQEAATAVMGADIIKLVYDEEGKAGTRHLCRFAELTNCDANLGVEVQINGFAYTLWQEELIPAPGMGDFV